MKYCSVLLQKATVFFRLLDIRSDTDGDEEEVEDEVYEVGLAAELGELKEDVIMSDSMEQKREDATWAQPAMRSEPVSKVFIEQKGKRHQGFFYRLCARFYISGSSAIFYVCDSLSRTVMLFVNSLRIYGFISNIVIFIG